MNTDLLLLDMNANEPSRARGFFHRFVVQEFEAGLLYQHGRFRTQLGPGRHRRWGFGYALATFDLRQQTLPVSGQEILSADHVGLKVSVAVKLQIADPLKAMHEVQDWRGHLYSTVQLTLRALVAAQPVEALLSQRLALGQQLLAVVAPEATKIGLTVLATEIKDVMFPGDLKKVFTEVIKARQEAQAALERARGESTALRNLANAARLLEGNPALQNLRLLQSIGAASGAGHTLVMGLPAGFVPMPGSKLTTAPANPEAGASS